MSWHTNASFDPPGADLTSPQQTSPILTSTEGTGAQKKRKRSSALTENGEQDHDDDLNAAAGNSSSPNALANGNRQRHQPGVKRACNDCRQQKVCCRVTNEIASYLSIHLHRTKIHKSRLSHH
jgi:hypothetical protein